MFSLLVPALASSAATGSRSFSFKLALALPNSTIVDSDFDILRHAHRQGYLLLNGFNSLLKSQRRGLWQVCCVLKAQHVQDFYHRYAFTAHAGR
jgi:hypothetical protein